MKTLGVIDVACDLHGLGAEQASRLSGKLASKSLRGQSLLNLLIRRVTEAERVDHVVAVFPKSEASRFRLTDLVPADVDTFVFDSSDPLKRIVAALNHYHGDAVVRVGLRSPFVDPALIDHLIDAAQREASLDYASYRLRDGKPAVLSHIGLFAEWCSVRALQKMDRLGATPDERRELTRYFFAHADHFRLKLIPVPDIIDQVDTRLTLEAMEDWELAEDILDALGHDGLTCYNLADLVANHPRIRERMVALNELNHVT